MPIEQASASVYVPEGITGLQGIAFTGAYGSSEQAARIEVGQRYAKFETTRPLGFRQGFTIVVTWNTGVVKSPGSGTEQLFSCAATGCSVFPF